MSKRERNRVAEIMESTLPLSYDELVTLHNMIVDRLDHLETAETHKRMLEFTPGCRVSFESKFGRESGVITKFNRKTVSVVTDSHRRYNISPQLLRKEVESSVQKPNLVIHPRNHKK